MRGEVQGVGFRDAARARGAPARRDGLGPQRRGRRRAGPRRGARAGASRSWSRSCARARRRRAVAEVEVEQRQGRGPRAVRDPRRQRRRLRRPGARRRPPTTSTCGSRSTARCAPGRCRRAPRWTRRSSASRRGRGPRARPQRLRGRDRRRRRDRLGPRQLRAGRPGPLAGGARARPRRLRPPRREAARRLRPAAHPPRREAAVAADQAPRRATRARARTSSPSSRGRCSAAARSTSCFATGEGRPGKSRGFLPYSLPERAAVRAAAYGGAARATPLSLSTARTPGTRPAGSDRRPRDAGERPRRSGRRRGSPSRRRRAAAASSSCRAGSAASSTAPGPARPAARPRALNEPGPFMGSRAIALSPDGQQRLRRLLGKQRDRDLHAATRKTGTLTQPTGRRAASPPEAPTAAPPRSGSTAPTRSPSAPTAATSTRPRAAATRVTVFAPQPERRGALRPAAGRRGCISGPPLPGCTAGRALIAPDVVVVSPDGDERLRRLLLRQRGRGLQPRPGHRRPDPAVRHRRLHRRSGDGRLRHRASPWSRPRAWRSAATAPASTPPPPLSNAVAVLARNPSTGRPDPGDRRQRLHRRAPADRLHHRHRSWRAPTRSRSAPTTTTST